MRGCDAEVRRWNTALTLVRRSGQVWLILELPETGSRQEEKIIAPAALVLLRPRERVFFRF